jgi:hypothetical protein
VPGCPLARRGLRKARRHFSDPPGPGPDAGGPPAGAGAAGVEVRIPPRGGGRRRRGRWGGCNLQLYTL